MTRISATGCCQRTQGAERVPGTIDLVGPKGYVHGWKYEGGPGLPSTPRGTGSKSPLAGYKTSRAGRLKSGDRIAYGSKGNLEEHKVIAVSHHRTPTGQVRTRMHLQRPDGSHHYTNVGSNSPVLRHMSDEPSAPKSGMDQRIANSKPGDWRNAIKQYDAKVASGPFKFGKGPFVKDYPSLGRQNTQLAAFVRQHVSQFTRRTAAIELARQAYSRHPDEDVKCPACGAFNMPDAKFCDQCGARLPESAFANLSNTMELAMPTPRVQPIRTPSDLIIARGEGGVAVLRHRMGGGEIGTIRRDGRGWRAAIGGKDLDLRTHQRTALADVIGRHNRDALTPEHRASSAGPELQPPAQQTPLMATYGIPAIRALATPTVGASDGPRVTGNDAGAGDSDDDGPGGLSPKGKQIYAKLKAKGWPDARAMAFAKRAQNMGRK